MFDIEKIRADFPLLHSPSHSKPLIYFDNASTTQKPIQVIQAMNEYYENYNANVHRGLYEISEKATEKYEKARQIIADFLQAPEKESIIFQKNATEGFNHIAYLLSSNMLKEGDKILLSLSEHHANIVPWQIIAKEKELELLYIELDEEGRLDMQDFQNKITQDIKILSLQHISNVSGVVHPIEECIKKAKENNVITVIDASQTPAHMKINIKKWNCDFLLCTLHKMFGPMGVGILYGKKELLENFSPVFGGGGIIENVEKTISTYQEIPSKLEPGTPNVGGVIASMEAIDYIEKIGYENIEVYEKALFEYALQSLQNVPYLKIHGPKTSKDRVGVISFSLKDIHPHDIAALLDTEGIAIRAGHHCAQLLIKHWRVSAVSRISLSFYNTKQEIDHLIEALYKIQKRFA